MWKYGLCVPPLKDSKKRNSPYLLMESPMNNILVPLSPFRNFSCCDGSVLFGQ